MPEALQLAGFGRACGASIGISTTLRGQGPRGSTRRCKAAIGRGRVAAAWGPPGCVRMRSKSMQVFEAQPHALRHDRESIPFADWLDGRLRTARISQRQLAMRAGVHHSTISRLVRHRRTPSFDTAVRLAQVLDPTGTLPVVRANDPRSTSPPMRVEYALRSDPSLGAGDVRDLMRGYLRLRARRRSVATSDDRPPAELHRVAASRG